MEPQAIDPPLVLASLLFLSVLGASLFLWVQYFRRPQNETEMEPGVSGWPIGWVNFGIFICTIITAIFMVQTTAVSLFFSDPPDGENGRELTPWLAVAGVLLLQLPMLAAFYGLRRFYPGHFAGRLSDIPLSCSASFKQAIPLFIRYLPVVWLAGILWGTLLGALEATGWIEGADPQALIAIFQDGGDPVAIGLLVVMAVVLAPVAEELIFRGCIYRFFKTQTTLLAAQVISAALFSLMHANLFSFVPLLLVGIFLAGVYERSGNLLVPIWFHAFFNGFSLLMLYLTSLSEFVPQ